MTGQGDRLRFVGRVDDECGGVDDQGVNNIGMT